MSTLRRRIMVLGGGDSVGYVDLGLPSGTLWAKGNICKDSQGNYYIGEGTEDGCYFSWANIVGYNAGEGYNFNDTNYNSTPGHSFSGLDISATDAQHNAPYALLGSPWRLPSTRAEVKELFNNTDNSVITIGGTSYMKLANKSDSSKYILFPFAGMYNGTTREVYGTYGRYWIAHTYSGSGKGDGFFVQSNNTTNVTAFTFSRGLPIRPVCSAT